MGRSGDRHVGRGGRGRFNRNSKHKPVKRRKQSEIIVLILGQVNWRQILKQHLNSS